MSKNMSPRGISTCIHSCKIWLVPVECLFLPVCSFSRTTSCHLLGPERSLVNSPLQITFQRLQNRVNLISNCGLVCWARWVWVWWTSEEHSHYYCFWGQSSVLVCSSLQPALCSTQPYTLYLPEIVLVCLQVCLFFFFLKLFIYWALEKVEIPP